MSASHSPHRSCTTTLRSGASAKSGWKPPAPVRATEVWISALMSPAYARRFKPRAVVDIGLLEAGPSHRVLVTDPFGNVFGIIENPHFKL